MKIITITEPMIKKAQTIVRLAEVGDVRLMAQDGPCGGQRPALSLKEGLEFDRAAYTLAVDLLASVK